MISPASFSRKPEKVTQQLPWVKRDPTHHSTFLLSPNCSLKGATSFSQCPPGFWGKGASPKGSWETGSFPSSPSLPPRLSSRLGPGLPDLPDGAPDLAGQVQGLGVALEDMPLDGGQADAPERGLAHHAEQPAGRGVVVHEEPGAPAGVEALAQRRGVLPAQGGRPLACLSPAVSDAAEGARGRAEAARGVHGVQPQQGHGAVAIWGAGGIS